MGEKPAKQTTRQTPKKEDVFFAVLSECGNVSKAAKKAKLSRPHLYARKKSDSAFSDAWDEAEALGVAALEDEAKRRAYDGWLEPVFHQGKRCGTIRKFSDTMLIVLLKAHLPDKYQERKKVDNTSSDGSMSPVPAPMNPLTVMEMLRRQLRDKE